MEAGKNRKARVEFYSFIFVSVQYIYIYYYTIFVNTIFLCTYDVCIYIYMEYDSILYKHLYKNRFSDLNVF